MNLKSSRSILVAHLNSALVAHLNSATVDENVVKLQNYYTPSELERAIVEWVEYYNNQRYPKALMYCGRDQEIIKKRKCSKYKPWLYAPAALVNCGCIIQSTRRKVSIKIRPLYPKTVNDIKRYE